MLAFFQWYIFFNATGRIVCCGIEKGDELVAFGRIFLCYICKSLAM